MSQLSVGIVGLPNVGKSTLFNALLKKQVALAANYPFATIEPNIGVVGVPDARLAKLAEVVHTTKLVPATVKFVDIAGLVKGASVGEGLGNKFLSHIREVDAMVYLLRDFSDENIIRAGSEMPEKDFEVLEAELILADLETVDKIINTTKVKTTRAVADKCRAALIAGKPMRDVEFGEEELVEVKQMGLLTTKPVIAVLNCDENNITPHPPLNIRGGEKGVLCISAKMEAELAELPEEEQKAYLAELGVKESGLERLIQKAFDILGLQTFLTAGEIEARAWTIKKGTKAPQAAGVIHGDFEKHFIKADCIDWQEFIALGGWTKAREVGKVRMEGRDYVMQDGDVVEFKVGV
jgi:ribosome-binding ATPase